MPVQLYDDEMKAILLEAAKVIRQIEAAMRTKSGAVSDAYRSVGDDTVDVGRASPLLRLVHRAVVCFCSS